jgi:hypothetical protein
MIKKNFWIFALLAAIVLAVLPGCPTEAEPDAESLDNTVWAAELPDISGGRDWLTITFRAAIPKDDVNPDGRDRDVAVQFASDTWPDAPGQGHYKTAEKYSYNGNSKKGSVSDEASGSQSAFTVSGDNKTLAFTDFRGKGPLTLKRLYPDAGNTFDLIGPVAADLKDMVWVSRGYRANDWVCLSFSGDGTVGVSHAADNSQFKRNYTYNGGPKTGDISYITDSFLIIDDDAKLRIDNFYGHGVPVDFFRVR